MRAAVARTPSAATVDAARTARCAVKTTRTWGASRQERPVRPEHTSPEQCRPEEKPSMTSAPRSPNDAWRPVVRASPIAADGHRDAIERRSSPTHRDSVDTERSVVTDHREPFDPRLHDQETIERILVVGRQRSNGVGVLDRDRQRREAVVVHGCRDGTPNGDLPEGALDGDLPRGHGAHIDVVSLLDQAGHPARKAILVPPDECMR